MKINAERTEEYADSLISCTMIFDRLFDEMAREDNFSAEHCLGVLKAQAHKEGVVLEDLEEFDYETFFWEAYEATETGLS